MTLESFLIAITVCYVVQTGLFIWALRKRQETFADDRPFVSVVVAARNEANNLPSCLNSLVHQTYGRDHFEVVIANDNSTDDTPHVCAEFANRYSNVRWVNVTEEKAVRGKGNALAQAIDATKGDIILITDADCEVPGTWIEATVRRYAPDVGLVGGMTLQMASKPFEGMQSLDWAYILGVASANVALGNPLGSIGNNLSFRKEAYQSVGGYRGIKFSVTEDYTLVQSIVRTKKWRFLYPIDSEVLVMSKPCSTWKDLIRQKHRWGRGGLDMKFTGLLIMAVSCLMIASAIGMLFWAGVAQCTIALMVKSVADYSFLYTVLSRLGKTRDLQYFWSFEAYFTTYVILLPLVVLLGGKVKWKGRVY
jgi:cellulose synthase/poly-beta-1,6-N-acetylglucosamine synthase-like glycosyltransferase